MPESLLLPSYSVMAEAEPDLSTFENKSGLAEDMKFLASMPELCDVTFLVGDTREPVCAVKAVLAARSRVFHKMLYQVFLGLFAVRDPHQVVFRPPVPSGKKSLPRGKTS